MTKRQAIIWGSSGHGLVVLDILEKQGMILAASVDRSDQTEPLNPKAPRLLGVEGLDEWLSDKSTSDFDGFAAIGGPRGEDRLKVMEFFQNRGIATPNLVHAMSNIAESATVGSANQFLAFSNISAGCQIGEGCIFNHGTSVDHESVIGNGVHIAPGATLCGLVKVGDFSFVGAGSVVLPRINIGEHSVIGAGSVVTKDVPPGTLVYGNPARPVDPI